MKCPGQDTQYWKAGAIFEVKCPKCHQLVEFFKDDTTRKCAHCGHRFLNPEMDFGCASYCQFAQQCLGNLPPELLAQKEDMLKDRVALAMKRHYKTDFRRIGRAIRVARYAERIGREEGANLAIVLVAAYLLELGSSSKQSGVDHHQEAEGDLLVRRILEDLAAKPTLVDAVCAIIRRYHHLTSDNTPEFQSVHDADKIATLEACHQKNPMASGQLEVRIEQDLLTSGGRQVARTVLLTSAL